MGVLFLMAMSLISDGGLSGVAGRPLGMAAGVGAAVGALFGPPIALIFLRRVPLWRATMETAAVAGLGAALGGLTRWPFGWLAGALVFALLDALRLRRVFARAGANEAAAIGHEGPGSGGE
jgi:hypothetical protein